MRSITRGVALALALGMAPAGILAVEAARHGPWAEMTADSRQRLEDGKLAAAKTALRLTAEQETLWAPVEAEVRARFTARAKRSAEWERLREERRAERSKEDAVAGGEPKTQDLAQRYEEMSKRLAARAEGMKAFSTAFGPFHASLSDEQKAVLGPVMHDLRLTGGRGHRRWANRGGPRGGYWGHQPRGGGHDASGAEGAGRQ